MPCDNGEMGFHHVALATHDTEATHRFYTEVMGFELVKVVAAATPAAPGEEAAGFSKHFFYSTGDDGAGGDTGMIAFWEINDPTIGTDFPVDLNAAAGLPWWVNHLAFDAPTRDALDAHRERWQRHGHTVLEVDHEFCVSIYIRDPSGNMVEFCHTTRAFTADERLRAMELLNDPRPPLEKDFAATIHHPVSEPIAGG
jgi:catechol 2,3-dioxygenase-like lactoylglutathione lyase family enzyme